MSECRLCSWPATLGEFGEDYCAWHQRLLRWWSDSYGTEAYEMQGRRFVAVLSGWRDVLRGRVLWLAETLYAIRYGGPFDFAPWSNVVRWWCRTFAHRWPECVGVADPDDDPRRWFLWRCPRCRGLASLPDGECGTRRFAQDVTYNSIFVGHRKPTPADFRSTR